MPHLADRDYHWLFVYVDGEYDHQEHCRCPSTVNHEADRKSQLEKRKEKADWARRNTKKGKR
jgi:hypothetical protein